MWSARGCIRFGRAGLGQAWAVSWRLAGLIWRNEYAITQDLLETVEARLNRKQAKTRLSDVAQGRLASDINACVLQGFGLGEVGGFC